MLKQDAAESARFFVCVLSTWNYSREKTIHQNTISLVKRSTVIWRLVLQRDSGYFTLAEMVFQKLFFCIGNDNKCAFFWEKSFKTWFVSFATLPKQLTRVKCIQKKKKTDLKIFQKQPTFCHFTKNTRQQSLLHSTKKIFEKFVLQTELSQSDVRTFFALYIRFYINWASQTQLSCPHN